MTVSLSLPSCQAASSWHEARRLLAPGGSIDAVLAERRDGRSDFSHEVFVVLNGAAAQGAKPVAILNGAIRNDSAYGASLHWVGRDTLRIEYLRAQGEQLLIPDVAVGGRRIRIVLSAGRHDPRAPAGAMVQARR